MNIAIKILEEQLQARELSYEKLVINGSVKKTSQVAMLNRLHVRQLNDAIELIKKSESVKSKQNTVEIPVVRKKEYSISKPVEVEIKVCEKCRNSGKLWDKDRVVWIQCIYCDNKVK